MENAIRHGLMTRKMGGTVTIEVGEAQDKILISVQDDGIGIEDPARAFSVRELSNRSTRGVGLANIRRRLKNYYGSELCLQSQKNNGTRVSFTIPGQI